MSDAAVTLNDVAAIAGVSVMTVSRALSGDGYVAEKTRARILEVVAKLGYTPNLSAKMMKGSRTNVVGVLINDLNSAVINSIVGVISACLRDAGKDMFIYNAIEDLGTPNNRSSQLLQGLCDGVLLVMPRMRDGHIEVLERIKLPILLINYCRTETTLPVVGGDNYVGAREAVRHLLALGHTRIGFIAGSLYSGQGSVRQRGYSDALSEAGIAMDMRLVADGNFSRSSGFDACTTLLSLAEAPTALFAANDEMALGAIDAARARGLDVPADLSIIGFDDIAAASQSHPALSTVRQPLDQISQIAVRELLGRINGTPGQQTRIELPSELVLRASTGPAPRKDNVARPRGVVKKSRSAG
jgi:LacI family transcriptional regulator